MTSFLDNKNSLYQRIGKVLYSFITVLHFKCKMFLELLNQIDLQFNGLLSSKHFSGSVGKLKMFYTGILIVTQDLEDLKRYF